jgi:hypothetical protein
LLRKALTVAVLLLLTILAAGLILDPYWWYRFIFEHQFGEWSLWKEAMTFGLDEFALWILFGTVIIYAILVLQRTTVPDHLLDFTKKSWANYIVGRKVWYVVLALLIVMAVGIWSSPQRSTVEQENAAKWAETNRSLQENQRKMEEIIAGNKQKPPLAEPTIFLFLDKELVESLYGQREPEVVLAEVAEETKTTDTVKVQVDVQKVLETSAGREQYQKRLSSYKATPKTTERKLRDLVWYLQGKGLINTFGTGLEFQSDELKNLNSATEQLARYGIVQDQKKLRALRDRLFAQELAALEKRLTNLKGLALIEGDWFVEVASDSYILSRPFAADVSNPATCEIRLHKSSLTTESRDTLEGVGRKPVRLAVFGNVTIGVSPASRTVQLTPIAIY